jgi:glyoxylase-like metal-dependent hydrolase (beta-lactamase superfamily II)
MSPVRVVTALASALAITACAPRHIAPLIEPRASAVVLTGGPAKSMVYLARTSAGVIAIDLGWWGGERAFKDALRDLQADPSQITDVFLTHTHRDHLGALHLVRQSRVHVAAKELSRLTGERLHRGIVPRAVEHVKPSGLPKPNELVARTFSSDTVFLFGADTLRAYLVSGHTAGSSVYLFRRTLFLGDAATYSRLEGYKSARWIYSDDAGQAAANLKALWTRLPKDGVDYVCTAHAHCRAYSADLLRELHAPAEVIASIRQLDSRPHER